MIIDWSNYRTYFKKIEKADTDNFTYNLIPKKIDVQNEIVFKMKDSMPTEEFRNAMKDKQVTLPPPSIMRTINVFFDNPKDQRAVLA